VKHFTLTETFHVIAWKIKREQYHSMWEDPFYISCYCWKLFTPFGTVLFLHLFLCTLSQNKALVLLNPNLFKFLGYHNRFLRYLQKRIIFFNNALTVPDLFWFLTTFSYSTCNKIWSGWDRNVLLFAHESWDPWLSSCKICILMGQLKP
jgi:hypothetical protein